MKILHLSDLHLEFGEMIVPESDADVVVLSGDTHIGSASIDWAANFNIPTIVILGNHEFYGAVTIEKVIEECRAKANLYPNVYFLENSSVLIDGVRFHGCTFWTDFELYSSPVLSMFAAKSMMNDFKKVTFQNRLFTPEDSVELHRNSREWLYQSIEHSDTDINVVVTHHLPTEKAIQDTYINSPLSPAFASNCTEFKNLSSKITLWLYGHNHDCCEFVENGILYSTNQRGYAGHDLVDGFDSQKLITI